jgi:atypical dual specificity phosphatase
VVVYAGRDGRAWLKGRTPKLPAHIREARPHIRPAMSDALYQVRSNLLFGSQKAVEDEAVLQEWHVSHVMSTLGPPGRRIRGITYGYVTLEDEPYQHLIPSALYTAHWIARTLQEGGVVAVNCHKGISRSSSVVIAYLILYEDLSYADALKAVKAARSTAQPNPGFVTQLKDLSLIAKTVRGMCPV